MPILMQREEALRRYAIIRNELRERSPNQWSEVVSLCRQVPNRIGIIDENLLWHFGKNKPCYSNIRVATGERIGRDMDLSPDFDSWKKIASPAWAITMRGRGSGWKKNDNFEISGHAAQAFVQSLARGGLKSFLWRLHLIRAFALALSQGHLAPSITELARHIRAGGFLPPENCEQWTRKFGQCVGMGWGPVTTYHMLTDLGMAVKPDLHLIRSVVRMGLLSPDTSAELTDGDIDGKPDLPHLAAGAAIELSQWITPAACPENPRSAIREVDKVLMEWSRQNLIRPLSRETHLRGSDFPAGRRQVASSCARQGAGRGDLGSEATGHGNTH